ncbi:uncharacterized protein LOC108596305 isoform X2 [Drosophila busckii]|uniref:uncharacterized protein LOC108596305 isoform X2 n=1 Tax=Drosophila busckii TaxID=30019 RepID=UPI00083F0A60|nr:uncharacterized protein LOC108596305 isoform X2 [Drosophila busckii]
MNYRKLLVIELQLQLQLLLLLLVSSSPLSADNSSTDHRRVKRLSSPDFDKDQTLELAKYVVSIRSRTPRLYFGDNHYCCGVIVAPKFVLTAAHCTMEWQEQNPAPEPHAARRGRHAEPAQVCDRNVGQFAGLQNLCADEFHHAQHRQHCAAASSLRLALESPAHCDRQSARLGAKCGQQLHCAGLGQHVQGWTHVLGNPADHRAAY